MDRLKQLWDACFNGDLKVVEQLLQSGANVNYYTKEAKENRGSGYCLHAALKSGQAPLVSLLVSKGAKIEATDEDGKSPLHYAALYGPNNESILETCELFISKGANVRCQDKGGYTPLHNAAYAGKDKLIALFISKGAPVNQQALNEWTALHFCARFGKLEATEVLIASGGDINSKDNAGKTSLHYAVEFRHSRIVELLLAKNAAVIPDNKGTTPLDLAIKTKVRDIVLLLVRHAKLNPKQSAAAEKALSWTEDDVIHWMNSLKLSKRYDQQVRNNKVNGIELLLMNSRTDWSYVGVNSYQDLLIIEGATNPVRIPIFNDTEPYSVPSTEVTGNSRRKKLSSPSGARSSSRSAAIDGIEEVTYKPVLEQVSGFVPEYTCRQYILMNLPSVLDAVRDDIPDIVEESLDVMDSCLLHLPSNIPKLTNDEALAIVVYSFDLCSPDPSKNLYYVLNKVLRERDPIKMQALTPYLFFLTNGLSKLPTVEATVFRGIPKSSMAIIEEKYCKGTTIQWSGFTSTTTSLGTAQRFSKSKGFGGVIMRISVMTGRNIQHYSALPSEEEVLLSPNCKLLVVNPVHPEADGYNYIDLAEAQNNSFVF